MIPASRVSRPLAQRLALATLLLCMALAQSLSLAHRALHHDVRMLAYAYEEQHAQTHAHAHDAHCDHGSWSRLFAGHEEGDEACRLIDGFGAFFGLEGPPALVFPALFAHVFIANGVMALAAWQAPLFEARGPPVFSL